LGKALAKSLINNGKKVIIAGKTASNVEAAAKELGPSCVAFYVVDVANISALPAFAEKVLKEHPEVDCLINNAGVQKELDFTKGIDINLALEEININIIALVQLCNLFAEHFQAKSSAVIMNVCSGLAYFPIKSVPIYCATKAFVKSFTQSLRAQFHKSHVSIIELSPPLVESDLHRSHANPHVYNVKTNPSAMTQEEFIRQVEEGWKSGSAEVGAGMALHMQQKWRDTFGGTWLNANQLQN